MGDLFSAINNKVINNLEGALDGTARRHKVISNNIANVDTPNFKRSDVNFQEVLKKTIGETTSLKLSITNPNHLSNIDSQNNLIVFKDNTSVFRNDGNNVDIEKEVVEMVKNNMSYNFFVELLKSKLGDLRYSIEEGKR